MHNSQPWHWRVGADCLHLLADPSRHLPRTDGPAQYGAQLGAALYHCMVALAAMGGAQGSPAADPTDRDHLATIEAFRQTPGDLDGCWPPQDRGAARPPQLRCRSGPVGRHRLMGAMAVGPA